MFKPGEANTNLWDYLDRLALGHPEVGPEDLEDFDPEYDDLYFEEVDDEGLDYDPRD